VRVVDLRVLEKNRRVYGPCACLECLLRTFVFSLRILLDVVIGVVF
jgi:hypothetical protein